MFDLNILPMNLVNGRNLGELPGLKIYTAPKKSEKSRADDVLIILITCSKEDLKLKEYDDWGTILSEAYYSARGSFTMGISNAVRQLASHLNEQYPGTLLPEVFLNIAVLRDRLLLIGHSGPVNSTVVFADHVDNFSDITSKNVSEGSAGLRFFQVDIHSGDLILLCPNVPHGWTNEAILDATSESPLNVVRYLLDQANGNLQGAVIQVKAGRGEILYRYKPPISTSVNLGYDDDDGMDEPPRNDPLPDEKTFQPTNISRVSTPSYLLGSDDEKNRPLYRIRLPLEPFPVEIPMKYREQPEPIAAPAEHTVKEEQFAEVQTPEPPLDIAEPEVSPIPELESVPQPEEMVAVEETVVPVQEPLKEEIRTQKAEKKRSIQKQPKRKKEPGKKTPFPWKRVFIGLFFGLMIPLIVVGGLVLMYTSRSKDAAYRDSLENAVNTAKVAIQQTEPSLQRVSWEKVLEYLNEAALYGKSEASRELTSQALEALDKLENSQSVTYNFALAKTLPMDVNITQIETTDQFLYALDASSGSILRFNIYANGLTLDSAFNCVPGSYRNQAQTDEQLKVGKLVDFVILPSESGMERVVAGIDNAAQMLYCPSIGEKKAVQLETPPVGWLGVNAIELRDRMLYVLDARNNAIWKFPYIGKDGFYITPQSYFGSSAPGMRDAVDFVIYANYAYILRNSGTLIICDYTGYIPLCSYVDEISDSDENLTIDLLKKHAFQMKMNLSPDNSLYLMDYERQAILNISVKLNLIRSLAPDRFYGQGNGAIPTAFGFLDQNRIIWAAGNVLYSGSIQ